MGTFESHSSVETKQLGEEFARSLLKKTALQKIAAIVALHGDLGAGKTTFTQGFARGLGINRRLISPTFVIMRRYAIPTAKGKTTRFKNLYHIDAYRLKNPDGLETLGLKVIFSDPTAIILIEWPENIKKILPAKTIKIEFEHSRKENERRIIMSG